MDLADDDPGLVFPIMPAVDGFTVCTAIPVTIYCPIIILDECCSLQNSPFGDEL